MAVRKQKPLKYHKSELKTFFYWMNERHRIWKARRDGEKFPWTKDPILQKYKFTNVFRQLDRVTEAWTDRYVKLLGRGKGMTDGDLFFHCLMFRVFNWPETYDALYYTMPHTGYFSLKKALRVLRKRKKEGHKIFTGAYIVSNGGSRDSKVNVYCKALADVHKMRHEIAEHIVESKSMERSVELLSELPLIGNFVAYEIACDLRHTRILSRAHDTMSWANPGPGARRGISRLLTGKKNKLKGFKIADYVRVMRDLHDKSHKEFKGKCEWPFELREVEHSLCEFDKYVRTKRGEGRPRSTFDPNAHKNWAHLDDGFDDERLDKIRRQIKNERKKRKKQPEKYSRYLVQTPLGV